MITSQNYYTMQLNDVFLLLLGVAIVPVVETARVERAVTGSIRFCNELDYDSPCITQELVPGKCHDLPDSAAKGYQRSSIYVSGFLQSERRHQLRGLHQQRLQAWGQHILRKVQSTFLVW